MNDIVIGAIGGYEFHQIKNWVYSLNQTAFDGDRVMISNGCSDDVVSKLKEIGELKRSSLNDILNISENITSSIIENISGDKLNESSIKAAVEDVSKKSIGKYL